MEERRQQVSSSKRGGKSVRMSNCALSSATMHGHGTVVLSSACATG